MPIGSIQRISFAGSGNVAWHLASALFKAGFEIISVYSRNTESAGLLAAAVGAKSVTSVSEIDRETDLLILALPDQVIPEFSAELKRIGKFAGIVAHTSGSQTMEVISGNHAMAGVIYPLQSFTRKSMPDISVVPFCIEGSTPQVAGMLAAVAKTLSVDVRFIDSARRASIHLAAVFACNFSNYLYAVSDCLLTRSAVNPDILLPLIRETAGRLKGGDAASQLTGPAVRKDWSTIEKHLSMLSENPDLTELYKTLSNHIVKLKDSGKAC
jgi:predicted short-subunit dehydrogenase-like oxidoreductase (DUF2520 family)